MNLSRREFSSVLAAALAAGFPLHRDANAQQASGLYDVPRSGNVHLLHMTDCHAQLLPTYFREPSVNLGVGNMQGSLPHLVGKNLLKAAQLKANTPEAYAFTFLDFERAARQYGKVGGFAHLATLVKQVKAGR
ncbi:MAG: thiosulfohydrolase SoxB, partial [Polaromonas sp.]|nr:thiosulfohydrolase SoxB [Polaromonas sp.]